MKQTISTKDLISILKHGTSATSFKEYAQVLGISPQYLHDVINGRRNVSAKLGAKLGYEMVVNWKRSFGGIRP